MELVFVPFPNSYGAETQEPPEYFNCSEIESIKQVHFSAWNKILFVVSHSGIVFVIKTSVSEDDQSVPCRQGISKLHPFDGSTNLRVKEIASYTEAVLFVVKDVTTQENFIYGMGNNGYYRMAFSREEDLYCSRPELMFAPKKEIVDVNGYTKYNPLEISQCGCCFSFSLCIIDYHDVHFTGQNWVRCKDEYLSNNAYHSWKFMVQRFKKRVVKMECGDFHSVVLHDDQTVSVAGSNSSNQLTTYDTFENDVPFVNIPLNYLRVSNVYSGSNTVFYLFEENEQKEFYFCGSKKNFIGEYSTNTTSKPMLEHKLVKFNMSNSDEANHHGFDYFSNIFDAQFTRDLFLGRSICNPKLIYLTGNSYYCGIQYHGTFFDISKIIPFDKYSKGMFPRSREADFYKTIVKIVLQHSGYVIYLDYTEGLVLHFFKKLLKATNTSNPNNHLLLDIIVSTHH
ncbi:hypothetical protein FDP41_011297 [Naegleria fowleri]|uniref:Uncharacterized protein n=1 Tax=Naegleria fowleri TaxID=5763 RepID=A0A6A5BYJ6_NAEFO|nr:uncharacterized protein FDP41_011297 [Naegleria fowleri]KAF0982367.1 hypothetical protein FDP41_011297 [Naegleria fowleri]